MKVTKSLLLGAAAGLVAMSGAQAADLPVKAKAVEYVKICSAYGAGFYYIPGTDICLRVGGYIFAEAGVKARSAAVDRIYDDDWNRDDNYWNWRTNARIILDARNNTAYGTLRAYMVIGAGVVNPGGGLGPVSAPAGTNIASNVITAGVDRAFIQFAGFTAGVTESFFSFGGAYSIVATATLPWDWLNVLAYTAQLGNGVSATIAIEDAQTRRTGITSGTYGGAAVAPGGYGGQSMPDVVGNVRVDQSWGSAQIMGALHEVRPAKAFADAGASPKWGYAVGGGFEIKTPQTGHPNNSILVQGQWTKGALEYTGFASSPATVAAGAALALGGVGPGFDAFDAHITGTTVALTRAWSAYGGYRHYWTPMLRTGFALGYSDIDPGGSSATANGGDPNITILQGFISTIWSPVAGLDLSLDLVYSKLETDSCLGAAAGVQLARCSRSDDVWTAWYRIRRNF